MKYKAGDKVIINDHELEYHTLNVGTEVEIMKVEEWCVNDPTPYYVETDGHQDWIGDRHIKGKVPAKKKVSKHQADELLLALYNQSLNWETGIVGKEVKKYLKQKKLI